VGAIVMDGKAVAAKVRGEVAVRANSDFAGKTVGSSRIRQERGRKRISSAKGHHYDLDEVFESLNTRFFHGLLGRPTLTWSAHYAKRMLGHYDAAHNTIVVSRVFDRSNTPRYAIEYLLYHEMLHLKHPVRVRAGRRCVHSREFQAEERLFPELELAREYLKRL